MGRFQARFQAHFKSHFKAQILALLRLSCFVFMGSLSLTLAAQTRVDAERESLLKAVRFDDLQTVQELVKQGQSPNQTETDRGETLLMICVREHSMKVFEHLLTSDKINLDLRANNGDTALMLAAYLEQEAMLSALIAGHAKLDQDGWTALHYAAVVGNEAIMKILLEHGAQVNALTPNQMTPLMLAARRGLVSPLRLLLEQGAQRDFKSVEGMTAYDFALAAEQRAAQEILKLN